MQIKHLEACTCVVPVEKPIAFSTREITERHFTLIRLSLDTGAEGLGYCYSGHKAGHLVTDAIRDLLRDIVVGREIEDVGAMWESMYQETLLHGRRGAVLRAMSVIDIALWDAMAQQAQLPLYRFLGAHRREVVPTYASGGYYADGKSPGDLAREMEGYLRSGFRAAKMKVGRLASSEDAVRVQAARKAVGADIPLFLDANNAWPDSAMAIEALRHFEEYAPGWIEEPLMPDDIEGHAVVARNVGIPVATGEVHGTRWDFAHLVEKKAAAILQPDVTVCGGITEWRRIAGMAAAANLPVAPHWVPEVHVHLVAATPNATWVEYFTDATVINITTLLQTRLEIRRGDLVVPQAPGLGVIFDEAQVKKYAIGAWA